MVNQNQSKILEGLSRYALIQWGKVISGFNHLGKRSFPSNEVKGSGVIQARKRNFPILVIRGGK